MSKSKTEKPKVVSTKASTKRKTSDLINDCSAGAGMINDAFSELVESSEVKKIVTNIEKAFNNAEKIRDAIIEAKKKAEVKTLDRYYGYYDIPVKGTQSNIPDSDTEYGVGSAKERANKILIRVYSKIEKPINAFMKGGASILLSRGVSITSTKGNRLYVSSLLPGEFSSLVEYLGENKNLWKLIAACYKFNEDRMVEVAPDQSGVYVEDLEDIEF